MKFLDKILLGLALVIFGVSAVWFLGKSPAAPEVNPGTLSEVAYQPLSAPEVPTVDASWPEPEPFPIDENALYGVFTPPEIFWHTVEQRFEFRSIDPPVPPEPFGLVLAAVEAEPYRVQFQTAVNQSAGGNLLQFFLPGREVIIEGEPGESFPEHGFEIRSYSIERVFDDDGTILRVPTAVIYDAEVGQEVELNTLEQRVIPGEFFFLLATTEPNPRGEYRWEGEPGESIAVEATERRYELVEANADAEFVVVRKVFENLPEKPPEVVRLEPSGLPPQNAPEPPATESAESPARQSATDLFEIF